MVEDRVKPESAAGVDFVVGIGASAGGLEALQSLVPGLVPGGRVAFVVAQHLSPEHPSMMADLLSRVTKMRVATALDGQVLTPETIFVAPASCDLIVDAGVLRVIEVEPGHGPTPSVDRLFDSIAASWGARGVGVVLSGTGSDGAHGLRAIRAVEGLALAQAPESAKFEAMPRAAIELGAADLVETPEQIAVRLRGLRDPGGEWQGPGTPMPEPGALVRVCAVLRRATGVDFSRYKQSTLTRQVARRMALRQVSEIEDYLPMLSAEADEAKALMGNLLVTVTSFFRDPGVFEDLGAQLLAYTHARMPTEQLRVWVPGCATGEEVYTLAMIVAGVLGHPGDLASRCKIFGTDLDEPALGVARRGVYPAAALDRIPPELRARYVIDRPAGSEISSGLREATVFARHNVGEDPPFPRLDLVSCRNTLMYFTPGLQDRVLHALRYALLPGGLLLLGSMEAFPASSPGFDVVDASHRIFVRTSEPVPTFVPGGSLSVWLPPGPAPAPTAGGPAPAVGDSVQLERLQLVEALLRNLAQPSLVLDDKHNLVEVVGDVSPYCRVPQGRAVPAGVSLLRPELLAEARALLLLARADSDPVLGRAIAIDGTDASVRMRARKLAVGDSTRIVLTFVPESGPAVAVPDGWRDAAFDAELERLEGDLLVSQDTLRRSLAELETTNEELQASTEELQGSAEELQASYEELETSNEELQATNEELGSLNSELRTRGDELQSLNVDLENIQASLSQGMILLDNDLRVTRFTPLAVRLFALVDSDIGSPLLSIPTTLPVPGLGDALRAVVGGSDRRSLEITGEHVTYLAQVLPYQARNGVRRGAIVTLTDVSEVVALRSEAQAALADFTQVTDALDEVVWKQDATSMEVLYVSPRIRNLTGLTPDQFRTRPAAYHELIEPGERARVDAVRRESGGSWSLTYQLTAVDGTRRWVAENGSIVKDPGGDFIVGTLSDISRRRAAEQQAADQSLVFESVFRNRAFGVTILDADGRVVMANQAFADLVGQSTAGLAGVPIYSLSHPEEHDSAESYSAIIRGEINQTEWLARRLVHRDGSTRWTHIDLRPLPRAVGSAAAIAVFQDISSLTERTERLSKQALYDALTGLLNRAALREALDREIALRHRTPANLALVWIDLDRFKEVNDRDGHEAGDRVLATIAARLASVVRKSDLVGRLGGDEFAVLITHYDRPDELDVVLDRIRSTVREPTPTDHGTCLITVSVGVALLGVDGSTANELETAADTAMYAAKAQGGDRVEFFQPAMNEAAESRRRLRADLSEAIRTNEFQMYYQPIVHPDGTVWGAEALVRWNHDGQVIPAGQFIGFCEESGLIRALGPITLGLLNVDLASLRQTGRPTLPVTMNLSVTQLEDSGLTELLTHGPAPAGLSGLVIEVTESVFLPAHGGALNLLGITRRLGARIAVDDFGSGFSNLNLLRALSPEYIKLDRSFLSSEPTELDLTNHRPRSWPDVALLESAITMAHALGAEVIAEGVEIAEQLKLATRLGADLIQGFGVARPMALPDLLMWLDSQQPPPGESIFR